MTRNLDKLVSPVVITGGSHLDHLARSVGGRAHLIRVATGGLHLEHTFD